MTLRKPIKDYFDQLIYAVGSYHYNWHRNLELLLILKGHLVANVDSYLYSLRPGEMLLINSNQGHATMAIEAGTLVIRTYIDPDFFADQGVVLTNSQFNLNSALTPDHPCYADVRRSIAKLYLGQKQSFALNSNCFRLAQLLYENFYVPSKRKNFYNSRQNDTLSKVAVEIQKKYRQQLSLRQLASEYNYSAPYFSKIFKDYFGIGFYEYLTRERLQNALKDLNHTEMKISDVATKNGFTEIKSFNVAFKKHFGITPTTYQHKRSPQLNPVDEQFQQGLSAADLRLAKNLLAKYLRSQVRRDAISSENDPYRQDSQRYHKLRKELLKLLNDNK